MLIIPTDVGRQTITRCMSVVRRLPTLVLFSAVMEDGQLCPLLFRTYAVYTTRGSVSGLLPGLDNVFHTANSRQLADAWTDWTGSTEPPTETTEPTEP